MKARSICYDVHPNSSSSIAVKTLSHHMDVCVFTSDDVLSQQ